MNTETNEELSCAACGTKTFSIQRKTCGPTIHVGAYCTACSKWLTWLKAYGTTEQTEPQDLTQVGEIELPFGKHKGVKLKDVPRDYLEWYSANGNLKRWVDASRVILGKN